MAEEGKEIPQQIDNMPQGEVDHATNTYFKKMGQLYRSLRRIPQDSPSHAKLKNEMTEVHHTGDALVKKTKEFAGIREEKR